MISRVFRLLGIDVRADSIVVSGRESHGTAEVSVKNRSRFLSSSALEREIAYDQNFLSLIKNELVDPSMNWITISSSIILIDNFDPFRIPLEKQNEKQSSEK